MIAGLALREIAAYDRAARALVEELQAEIGQLMATTITAAISRPKIKDQARALGMHAGHRGQIDVDGGRQQGPDLYVELMRTLTASFRECLGATG